MIMHLNTVSYPCVASSYEQTNFALKQDCSICMEYVTGQENKQRGSETFPLQHTHKHTPQETGLSHRLPSPISLQVSHHSAIYSTQTEPKWVFSFSLRCPITHIFFSLQKQKAELRWISKCADGEIPNLWLTGWMCLLLKIKQADCGAASLLVSLGRN